CADNREFERGPALVYRTSPRSRPPQPLVREGPLNKQLPSMLASCPASMLNQISLKLGIPFDSFLSHPALEGPERPCNSGRASNIVGITPRMYHNGQRV